MWREHIDQHGDGNGHAHVAVPSRRKIRILALKHRRHVNATTAGQIADAGDCTVALHFGVHQQHHQTCVQYRTQQHRDCNTGFLTWMKQRRKRKRVTGERDMWSLNIQELSKKNNNR